tara:strand:- start:12464 stop:13009 length:546 start_codon:yes stop_codon:yes gene_type:complete
MTKAFDLLPLDESNLAMVLAWRNAPSVRKNMYTSHEISLSEHKLWFKKLVDDKSRLYFVASVNDVPCGVIGFTEINLVKGIASWAFYTDPLALRGSGTLMEFYAIDYAFNNLNLHKLKCEVLGFNKSVIKLHTKFGFIIEGDHRDAYFNDGRYHNIVHLGLLSTEWTDQRVIMMDKLRMVD